MPAAHFEPRPFHPERPGLVAPVRRDPTGRHGPTRAQAQGARWRPTSHGFHVPATVERTVDQRILEAAATLPAVSGITGWAALRWMGGEWFDGLAWRDGELRELPVTIATGVSDVRRQPGVEPSAERLNPCELIEVDGLWVTIPERSVCFEMRYASTDRAAVRVFDMAAYSDLVSLEEMWLYAQGRTGSTGIPRCRWGLIYGDENAWSPSEVDMRLVWTLDAGLPRPLCNVPIFDRLGRHIGTPDVFDPDAGVVGEYDGALHLEGAQRSRDVRREAEFRGLGLEYVTMLAGDLSDTAHFVRRLREAYLRAERSSGADRRWTLEPPPWWVPTTTVAQRRALTRSQRHRLLARRAG